MYKLSLALILTVVLGIWQIPAQAGIKNIAPQAKKSEVSYQKHAMHTHGKAGKRSKKVKGTAKKKPATKLLKMEGKTCRLVTSTAYTRSKDETDDTPDIAAWGYRYTDKDHWKSVALSRDLLALGLSDGDTIWINGEPKRVSDKMARRWRQKVDLLVPTKHIALNVWGKRKVSFCY